MEKITINAGFPTLFIRSPVRFTSNEQGMPLDDVPSGLPSDRLRGVSLWDLPSDKFRGVFLRTAVHATASPLGCWGNFPNSLCFLCFRSSMDTSDQRPWMCRLPAVWNSPFVGSTSLSMDYPLLGVLSTPQEYVGTTWFVQRYFVGQIIRLFLNPFFFSVSGCRWPGCINAPGCQDYRLYATGSTLVHR